jgi:predicted enzyme involved in methoxymalonyl-ACP biosynthesis
LSGLASLELQGRRAVLVDFLLSCRVIGRKIEETMLHHLVTAAAGLGAEEVVASVKLTSRNGPCLRFFETSGFLPVATHQFSWNAAQTYPLPLGVELVCHDVEHVA